MPESSRAAAEMTESAPESGATSLLWAARKMDARRGEAARLRRMFDSSLVPMAVMNNDRRYVAANRAARLVSHMPEAELVGRRVGDSLHPPMTGLIDVAWSRMLADGSVAGRYQGTLEDGSHLRIAYCILANILPGKHLLVFVPADWPSDELCDDRDCSDGPSSPPSGPLTRRERDVLTLVAAGASSPEIGERLSISAATVRTHVKNAHKKLGVHNRAQAIAMAVKLELIDYDGAESGEPGVRDREAA